MASRHTHRWWTALLSFGLLLSAIPVQAQPTLCGGEVIWSEDFESGWGDWYTDAGVWEIGKPTKGPSKAHGGQAVAGTNLSGNYPADTDSRLVSPVITLPSVSGDERLELRYWQWYSYNGGDNGTVQVSAWTGTKWGNWTTIHTPIMESTDSNWSLVAADLKAYAGQTIQIGFLHTAYHTSVRAEGPGWYIDDVRIWKGIPTLPNPETFEFGWGDWYTDQGVWEIGKPTSGPNKAYSGQAVAATNLSGNYPADTDSRLVSSPTDLPLTPSLRLRFWQWYSYSGGDVGHVQISVWDGARWGVWKTLHTSTAESANSEGSLIAVPGLAEYAGRRIRIAFYHTAYHTSVRAESAGWYIDDVQITPTPETWWVTEDTGVSRTDKLTNDTTPELTFVFPHVVNGQNSDIEVTNPDDVVMVPDSVSGWGTNTVVVRYTTPLPKDDQYTVTLKGTITDAQGQAIHDGADKVLHFTLDTKAPVLTAGIEITGGATIVLAGTVDDPEATVEVIIGNKHFAGRNCGNGRWVLPGDMIDSASAGNINDAVVVATDSAGNVTAPPVPVIREPCDLLLSSTEGGSVTVPGEGVFPYPCGQIVCLEAQADPGYRFVRWEVTGGCPLDPNETDPSVCVTVGGHCSLKAVFEPLLGLTLAVIGQGSIDPEPGTYYVSSGETVCVTAFADSGFRFRRWEGTCLDAAAIADQSTICVTIDGSCTLTAVFEEAVYDVTMDVDPGWALGGQWEYGVPTGQRCSGWGNVDPTSGHTGPDVIGVNLDGCYDLEIGGPCYATAGPLDLSRYEDVTLRFWRWLNCDIPEYVRCTVELSTDGVNWTVLWTQAEREEITDMEWTLCEYTIPQTDCQPTVYVRWSYQVLKERAYAYTGWNLDDVQMIGCLGPNR